MRNLIIGMIVGSCLTGTMVSAGNLYNSKGQNQAPSGSQQQFDYFRQRQQYLDIQALRQQADRDRINQAARPCAK